MMGQKEKVVPDLNMAIFGIYVRFLGRRVGHISLRLHCKPFELHLT